MTKHEFDDGLRYTSSDFLFVVDWYKNPFGDGQSVGYDRLFLAHLVVRLI